MTGKARKKRKTPLKSVRDRTIRTVDEIFHVLDLARRLNETFDRRGTTKGDLPPRKRQHYEVLISSLAGRTMWLARVVRDYESAMARPRTRRMLESFHRPWGTASVQGIHAPSAVEAVFRLAKEVIDPVSREDLSKPTGVWLFQKHGVIPLTAGWLDRFTDEEYAAVVSDVGTLARRKPLTKHVAGMLVTGIRSDYRGAVDRRRGGGRGRRRPGKCPVRVESREVYVRGKLYTEHLTEQAINVLQALEERHPRGWTGSQLIAKSGQEDAVGIVNRLWKREDALSAEIVLPVRGHRGGYRFRSL